MGFLIEPTKPHLYKRHGKWWATDRTGCSGSGRTQKEACDALRNYQASLERMYRMEQARVDRKFVNGIDLSNTAQGGFLP